MNYDCEYYYNLLKIHTHTAKAITDIRWNFLKSIIPLGTHAHIENGGFTVLDYGCGVGWFKAFKPDWVVQVDTFDIMPVPQTGLTRDKYTVLTMWDVLEHIPDFTTLVPILEKVSFVAMTIPIKPEKVGWGTWKHFKPGEHLQYYTEDLLKALFDRYDFQLMAKETPECPPREDVVSFLFNHERLMKFGKHK